MLRSVRPREIKQRLCPARRSSQGQLGRMGNSHEHLGQLREAYNANYRGLRGPVMFLDSSVDGESTEVASWGKELGEEMTLMVGPTCNSPTPGLCLKGFLNQNPQPPEAVASSTCTPGSSSALVPEIQGRFNTTLLSPSKHSREF